MAEHATRRSLWVLLSTVLGMGVTISMGIWQLDRAAQKQQLHDTLVARQSMPSLGNMALPCQTEAWLQKEQRQAQLTGRWMHEHTVVLDNRPMQGRPGLLVLTPLLLTPAPVGCPKSALLVQRGWLPRDPYERTRIPEFAKPPGEVVVTVRLTFAPSKMLSLQRESAPEHGLLRQNVDLGALAKEWQVSLLPGSAQQLVHEQTLEEPVQDESMLRAWWQPVAEVGKHQAYAAQWFLMALVMLGLYGWFQWWRPYRAAKE